MLSVLCPIHTPICFLSSSSTVGGLASRETLSSSPVLSAFKDASGSVREPESAAVLAASTTVGEEALSVTEVVVGVAAGSVVLVPLLFSLVLLLPLKLPLPVVVSSRPASQAGWFSSRTSR